MVPENPVGVNDRVPEVTDEAALEPSQEEENSAVWGGGRKPIGGGDGHHEDETIQ